MGTMNPVAVTFEHILVPTDFSEVSERALEYAKTLAKQANAELLLVHVEPPVIPITPPEAAWIDVDEIQAMHEEQLGQRGATLVSEGYRAKTLTLTGGLYEELLTTIKKNQIDLMVVGTHSRKGLERLLLGSDAEAMLRRAHCPVLSVGTAVPDIREKAWSIGEIVCATTFDPKSVEVAVYAWKLAAQYGANLTFFHVTTPGINEDMNWLQFEEAFRQRVPEGLGNEFFRSRVARKGAASSIADFAAQHLCDLIVMGATPANSIATHFPAGTVAKVLMESHCPILTLLQQ
jgi:nucleotide-binding universal stress UspA family protein